MPVTRGTALVLQQAQELQQAPDPWILIVLMQDQVECVTRYQFLLISVSVSTGTAMRRSSGDTILSTDNAGDISMLLGSIDSDTRRGVMRSMGWNALQNTHCCGIK